MRISKAELASEIERDCVLARMVVKNIPLNRRNYLALAYLGNPPKPLGVEEEAELPSFLQNWKCRHAE